MSESRQRIEATKRLTLDERISILRNINAAVGVTDVRTITPKQLKSVTRELVARGYEPMMFYAAGRVMLSGER